LIVCFPDLFIKGQLHLLLGALQFCGLVGYLIYLLRFLARQAAMITGI
jgi:preprotein translocase subunit Sss1